MNYGSINVLYSLLYPISHLVHNSLAVGDVTEYLQTLINLWEGQWYVQWF